MKNSTQHHPRQSAIKQSPRTQQHLLKKTSNTFLSKILVFLLFTGFVQHTMIGQTVLTAGDIVVTGYSADGGDKFSFLLLVPIDANTSITFTDQGWTGTTFFTGSSTEGIAIWTSGTALSCGTEVVISATSALDSTADIGTTTGGFNFATSGDQIIAYQGSSNAPTFITAFHNENGMFDLTATNINDSALPPGLVEGVSAFAVNPEIDNVAYSGSVTNDTAENIRAAIYSNSASPAQTVNWNTDNGIEQPLSTITWNFTSCLAAPNTAPTATAPTIPTVLEENVNVPLADNIAVADADGDDQTVTFTCTGGILTLGTASITFGGGGNGTPSFTAAGTLANINAALDAATFTPTPDLYGTNAGSITFTSNDGNDTSNVATVIFDILAVNDAPSFTKGADPSISEDAGAQTINGWATAIDPGATNESSQTLSFIVTNDNNALFSAQPAIDASGNLTYTSALHANGSATVNVILTDDGGTANGGDDSSAAQSFTITVDAVNDEPSFTQGPNEITNENSGMQTINGWATAIDTGAANESSQTLSFMVSNDNNALFSAQPGLDASGNLTYTPAMDATGIANVSVTLTDDGGTANGGDDTSPTQQFTITVVDVTPPTVAIGSPNASLTNTGPISYTITYTDADTVTLAAGDITLNTTGDATGSVAVSGTGTTERIVTLSSITGNGTIGISLAAGTASDNAGNTALAAGPSATFQVDNQAPSGYVATFNQNPINLDNQDMISISFAGTEVGATAFYTISSSGGGTPITGSELVPATSGTTPNIDLSSLPDGAILLAFHLIDLAGNIGADAFDSALKDTEAPTVVITSMASNPTITSPIPVTFTFSESVVGFAMDDLTITNGTAGDFMGTGALYTANITPIAAGEVTININAASAMDIYNNGNTAATEFSITYNDPPLGTEDASLNQEWSLTPNPTNGMAIITAPITFDLQTATVFDIHGRMVVQQSLSPTSVHNTLDLSGLKAGCYFVEVASNSSTFIKRISKQ